MVSKAGAWREALIGRLQAQYEERHPRSAAAYARALRYLVDGGSHGARMFAPYAFRIVSAQGSRVRDLDGHDIIDFWQGHYANILGHNPPQVSEPLAQMLRQGQGLQTGLPDELQTDMAELLLQRTGDERLRFTTAGSLATMYAIMLARGFTGRSLVLKAAGGWHGAQPLAIRGTHYGAEGFAGIDSQGVPQEAAAETIVTQYNDVDQLRAIFERHGDRLACFILELCPGNGGFMLAKPAFVRAARELTQSYGAVLIIDEIITGFRFAAGGLQRLYGVQADLSTYGKIIGGGMPVSAVTGRADIMELAGKSTGGRVMFNGGTFSAHPASMLAGKTVLEHLVRHEDTIYPQLAEAGDRMRAAIEQIFAQRGVLARCTGWGNELVRGGSLIQVHFPHREDVQVDSPEAAWNPDLCDVQLRERVLKLGLVLRGVNVSHGLGAISTAHSEADLAQVLEAYDWVAQQIAAARAR